MTEIGLRRPAARALAGLSKAGGGPEGSLAGKTRAELARRLAAKILLPLLPPDVDALVRLGGAGGIHVTAERTLHRNREVWECWVELPNGARVELDAADGREEVIALGELAAALGFANHLPRRIW